MTNESHLLVINTWDIIWLLRYVQLFREQKLCFIIYNTDQNKKDSSCQEEKTLKNFFIDNLHTYV